ncbi:MAG: glycosyltransferase family 2 protein [Bacteroidales bacterium]|nr:glycosyltransferase family 2 protein [Bacteroidales bacterium]
MAEPLVSVIVPVYNVETYLRRCLDSIASQTYRNIEVIVVDDGSTDSSGVICDEFAKVDSRFRVIHQENKWLSGARNTGLDNARGDCICFVDGDDFVSPEYVSTLYGGIDAGYDLSMVNFDYVNLGEESLPTYHREEDPPSVLSGELCLRGLILGIQKGDFLYGVVWNKMYPRRLIENIRFDNFYSIEDAPFNLRVYSKAKSVYYSGSKCYNYVIRPNSIMGRGKTCSPKIAFNRAYAYKNMYETSPAENTYIKSLLLQKFFSQGFFFYRDSVEGTEFEKPLKGVFRGIWRETWRDYMKLREVPLKSRVVLALGFKFPLFWRLYKK